MLERRQVLGGFVAGMLGGVRIAAATQRSRTTLTMDIPDIKWHDVTTWGVEGKGFAQTQRFFARLPADAKGAVPESVWDLSHHSAGMAAHFQTDAAAIHLRYTLLHTDLAMPHMPATGVSGMDLYGLDGTTWRWAAVFKPAAQQCDGPIIDAIEPVLRQWRLYLPLYNGVEALSIGVPVGASFTPMPPRERKPIVFYGTSILHGACASRPGMAWPAIVGRRLDVPTINLGFSGSGRMEAAVAEQLARIDASAFVIDCAPNMSPKEITERTIPLVQIIRAAHPEVPIVLVEDRRYTQGWIQPAKRKLNELNAKALLAAREELAARGFTRLGYVDAARLLGADGQDALTDGSHPNDHGMLAYAAAVAPELGRLLEIPVQP